METNQLYALCSDLISSATTLKSLCSRGPIETADQNISSEPRDSLLAAEHNLYATLAHSTTLLAQPRGFVFQLATHVQLLACLKYFGEFQVLPCVPLHGCISMKELSALADAPEPVLCRIIRMAATAGFLQEPEPCYVAHTPLSAAYTEDLSSSDAAMFLAHYVTPSVLMRSVSTTQTPSLAVMQPTLSWANTNSGGPFGAALNPSIRKPQIWRQWAAYCQSIGVAGNRPPYVPTNKDPVGFDPSALLSQLEWPANGTLSIVHICAAYNETSTALGKISSNTQVIVQTYGAPGLDAFTETPDDHSESLRSRIEIQMRQPGTPQFVENATAYILQPDFSRNEVGSTQLLACELKAHYDCLQNNRAALLVVAPRLLPEPGSVASHIEAGARLSDFANLQLNNQYALEVSELFSLIGDVGDSYGKLSVRTSMQNDDGATVALVVKFEPY